MTLNFQIKVVILEMLSPCYKSEPLNLSGFKISVEELNNLKFWLVFNSFEFIYDLIPCHENIKAKLSNCKILSNRLQINLLAAELELFK